MPRSVQVAHSGSMMKIVRTGLAIGSCGGTVNCKLRHDIFKRTWKLRKSEDARLLHSKIIILLHIFLLSCTTNHNYPGSNYNHKPTKTTANAAIAKPRHAPALRSSTRPLFDPVVCLILIPIPTFTSGVVPALFLDAVVSLNRNHHGAPGQTALLQAAPATARDHLVRPSSFPSIHPHQQHNS